MVLNNYLHYERKISLCYSEQHFKQRKKLPVAISEFCFFFEFCYFVKKKTNCVETYCIFRTGRLRMKTSLFFVLFVTAA